MPHRSHPGRRPGHSGPLGQAVTRGGSLPDGPGNRHCAPALAARPIGARSGVREGLGFSTRISGQRALASGSVMRGPWGQAGEGRAPSEGPSSAVVPASREAQGTSRSRLCGDKPSGLGLPRALRDLRSPPRERGADLGPGLSVRLEGPGVGSGLWVGPCEGRGLDTGGSPGFEGQGQREALGRGGALPAPGRQTASPLLVSSSPGLPSSGGRCPFVSPG